MKSLKFLSLWAVPLFLFFLGKSYESSRATTTTNFMSEDDSTGSCPIACKDTVNISWDEHCEVNVTPYMIYGDTTALCSLQSKVEVFDRQNRSLGTHIPNSYRGQTLRYQLTNLKNGDQCWGNIVLQDNAPPTLVCPEPADHALVAVYANRLVGELSSDDEAFSRHNFTCWLSNQTQEQGLYYLDTIPFRVEKDGIYTFVLLTDFDQTDRGAGAIFQDEFYTDNPCQNIIGFTEGGSAMDDGHLLNDWWIQTPGLGDYLPWLNSNRNRPVLRIQLELKKGEQYYLATTSLKPEDTGEFAWLVFRDEVTQLPASDILTGREIHSFPWLTPLVCDDVNRIKLNSEQCYRTDASGRIVSISSELRSILELTGYPHDGELWHERGGMVSDNCGDIEVCVTDVFNDAYGSCDNIVLQRTFRSRDAAGNIAICNQAIRVRKPTVKDIVLPNYTAYIECDEQYPTDSLENPHPSVTGYPFVKTAFGFHNLTQPFCNIAATYTDKSRVNLCENAFKFIRVWTIYDWCNPGNTVVYNQLIKIGDFTPPEVVCTIDADGCVPTFSTGPFACGASVIIPAPDTITDNCSGWKVTVDVIVVRQIPIENDAYEIEEVVFASGKKPGDVVNNIPKGVHYFRYRVEDDCKNVRTQNCEFEVLDQSEPIAICKDFLNVSMGSTGSVTRLYANDVDDGSFDNCGNIKIQIRRIVDSTCIEDYEFYVSEYESIDGGGGGNPIEEPPIGGGNGLNPIEEPPIGPGNGGAEGGGEDEEDDGIYRTEWADYVYFTCCDIGQTVRVEMRVWDDADDNGIPGEYENIDYCGREIVDNYNICWLDVLVEDKSKPTCKPPANVSISCLDPRILHTSHFTCGDSILLNELFGEFVATDNCEAFMVCDEVIDRRDNCGAGTITRIYHAEDIAGNVSAPCQQVITVQPGHNYEIMFPADISGECSIVLDTVIGINEIGCDLLAVNIEDERFSIPTGECFKIFRTFRVINWCEYDGISAPIVISRDEDCDGIQGEEPVYVLRRPGKSDEQPAFIDRNANEFDNNPQAGERRCEGNPAGYWRKSHSVGYWQYTQLIKVYDSEPPIIYISPGEIFCSEGNDCAANIGVPFLVQEDCTPNDLSFEAIVDLYNDSIDFFVVPGERIRGQYPKFRFEDRFPIGEHSVQIITKDGCGNANSERITLEVRDCKPPAITCINGLAVELSPVVPAADVNGDGTADNAFADIWADDFVQYVADDCSDNLRLSINRVGDAPDINQKRLVFTCSDAGNTIPVQIIAWDNANNPRAVQPDGSIGGPNVSSCFTYILVQENILGLCGLPAGVGVISGEIANPEGKPLADVSVSFTNAMDQTALTDVSGRYVAKVPMFANEVLVTPQRADGFLDGVSTYDLVLISQHILGVKTLDSPYKIIAADVNNSGSVSILDVILLRKMILGIETSIPGNTSWRFIDKNYRFPVPSNPWFEKFPEQLRFRQMLSPIEDGDFIAVKVGDVDLSAIRSSARQSTPGKIFAIETENIALQAGQEVIVPFSAHLAEVVGYQFAFFFDLKALELVDVDYGLAQAENFGWQWLDQGLIPTSWHHLTRTPSTGEKQTLVRFTFRAQQAGLLSNYLSISGRSTAAEAYTSDGQMQSVKLIFTENQLEDDQFTLLQNVPNPFADETVVMFYLPRSAKATLKVFSGDGKMVHSQEETFADGYQQMVIRRSDLPGSGVYFYTLEADGWRATMRMVRL